METSVAVKTDEMAQEEFPLYPDYRRRLYSDVSVHPLPDLILQSSPRRNRSASINLPPDHAVLRDIGRSLRRISDDFQSRMAAQQRQQQQQQGSNRRESNGSLFTLFRRV